MSNNNTRIAHLDMDAFYASVELLRYPELRGLPVVIGGRSAHKPVVQEDGKRSFSKLREYTGRGVVTTSTYEARAMGVFSAMGIMKAAQLIPDAILLPADFDMYRNYSLLFKSAVAKITPHIEDRGVDEIYIDLTGQIDETNTLALRIKHAVTTATGLSCSIGVAPNKLLAKICSDLEKPNGLTVLTISDIKNRIWPLSVRKLNGVGPKAGEKLAMIGIHTIGDLANAEPELLHAHFSGGYASWLTNSANGIDNRPVITNSEPKSISRETTFERDLHIQIDRDVLSEIFKKLCERVAEDLHRKGYVCRTIGIKLRYADFKTVTRDVTLSKPTSDKTTIHRAARECLRRVPLDQKLRLLGVKANTLSKPNEMYGERESPQSEFHFNE